MSKTLEKLLFRREQFPIVLRPENRGGFTYFNYDRVVIPPYHPSMRTTGIQFSLVPELLHQAIDETVKDFEEIAKKIEGVRDMVDRIPREKGTGRVICEPVISDQSSSGIYVTSIPIIDAVWVDSYGMNPYGFDGDNHIIIRPGHGPPRFTVPDTIDFSPEQMKEYGMRETGGLMGRKTVECPNSWHQQKLRPNDAIFYKNLVIALDNAVVMGKYR